MRKLANITLTSAYIVLMAGCGNTGADNGFTISGTVNGIDSGVVKLYRYNAADRTSSTLDSVAAEKGKFTLNGHLESPEMMTLRIEPGNWSLPVFVENARIAITADTAGSSHYDWRDYGGEKGAQLRTFTITGSATQDAVYRYENDARIKQFDPQFEKMQQEYAAAADKAQQEEIRSRMDIVRDELNQIKLNWIDSFVTANPASASGAYMLDNFYMFNEDLSLEKMESIVARFKGEANSTPYYKTLANAIAKRKALQPGNAAPDFTLLTPDSSQLALSSLKGKYVLLDFWASWCAPCRAAIPHWKELYGKYQPQGLEILGVTNDSKWGDWRKALEEENMPWLQVADEFPVKNMPARVAEDYMIPYLPSYTLLDRDGKILIHNGSKEQITQELEKIFMN